MAKDISQRTRKIVNERDDGVCQLCGARGVHLHHIIPRSRNRKLIDDPNNLITLCFRCHQIVHSNMKYWMQYLLERKNERDN